MYSTTKHTAGRSTNGDSRYSQTTRGGLTNTMREITLSQVRTLSSLNLIFMTLPPKIIEVKCFISLCSGAEPVFRHDIQWVSKKLPPVWATGNMCVEVAYIVFHWNFLTRRCFAKTDQRLFVGLKCKIACVYLIVFNFCISSQFWFEFALCRTALLRRETTSAAMDPILTPLTGGKRETT